MYSYKAGCRYSGWRSLPHRLGHKSDQQNQKPSTETSHAQLIKSQIFKKDRRNPATESVRIIFNHWSPFSLPGPHLGTLASVCSEVRNISHDFTSCITVPTRFFFFPGYLAYFMLTSVTHLALILSNYQYFIAVLSLLLSVFCLQV